MRTSVAFFHKEGFQQPIPRPFWEIIENGNTFLYFLTHWGRVMHKCVGNLTIIGSDNGLSPDQHQAIIWTNAGLLLIGPLGTNFSEILMEILTFSFKKMHLKVSCAKRRPFCLGLNVLTHFGLVMPYSVGELDQHWFTQWLVAFLKAPGHYLNQCWFTINKIIWHSFQGNVYLNTLDILKLCLKFTHLKSHTPGDNELKWIQQNNG